MSFQFSTQPAIVQPVNRNPWSDPIRCPLILYVILVVLGAILNLKAIADAPNVDRNGRTITYSQKWTAGIIGLVIYLIISYLFGMWIYNLCKKGQTLNSWLVFLLAIFFPLILALVVGLIVGAFLGISMFFSN